ncbi:MAG: phosphoribosylpyrophosphate synthetase, partial [Planctomycetota bacterium]
APIDYLLATDTIPQLGPKPDKLEVVTMAPLLSKAILHIHRAESISSLFE